MIFRKRKKDEQDGFIRRLRAKLNSGDNWLSYDLANLAATGKIDEDLLEEIESGLVMSDVGVAATGRIIASLQQRLARKELRDIAALREGLRQSITEILAPVAQPLELSTKAGPFVILMVGVNGAGKTTTIGKLAQRYHDDGYSVMLAAGDTFRAAAVEQLQSWGSRLDIPVISQQTGADAAAVLYDAYEAAKARGIDVLLADTAGRLQNQTGLMDELAKIKRVLQRHHDTAPQEIMLVLDASLGQNALVQAEKFHAALGLTGITVTKLDGSAKGGILIAIAEKLGIPVRFIGIGESAEDMQPFDANDFAEALIPDDCAPGQVSP